MNHLPGPERFFSRTVPRTSRRLVNATNQVRSPTYSLNMMNAVLKRSTRLKHAVSFNSPYSSSVREHGCLMIR